MLTKVHERNWKSTFSKIEAFKEDDDDDEPCDCWPLIQRFKHTIFDEKKTNQGIQNVLTKKNNQGRSNVIFALNFFCLLDFTWNHFLRFQKFQKQPFWHF